MSASDYKKIELKADTTGLDSGRDFLVDVLVGAMTDSETTFALTTSYLELFENIIRHGYAGAAGSVIVEIDADPKTVKITVTDFCRPFSILEYKDVGQAEMIKKGIAGKMGIKTILTLCDKVEYSRMGDKNVHVLIKNRG
jgi:anti-sigma regulatory factor (Ser/Thr protein kinase)